MSLESLAAELAQRIPKRNVRLVMAESCTAGLVAATLTQMPGASTWFCGSAVVYREATKQAWLGVAPESIAEFTAVSAVVARQMANGALEHTPEAALAASVTGHLGPDAPDGFDGLVFIATAWRKGHNVDPVVNVQKFRLQAEQRLARQREAAELVMRQLSSALDNGPPE